MKRPVRTKERYILDSLEKAFPGGYWVNHGGLAQSVEPQDVTLDDAGSSPASLFNGGEGVSQPENYEQPLYVTVVGGQKYDEQALYDALEGFEHYVVGAGRGVESHIAKTYFEGEYTVVPVNPDLYGKAARKVNVEQVLSFAPTSPLLLVGTGERVKQAKAWLKRAKWGREVVELP